MCVLSSWRQCVLGRACLGQSEAGRIVKIRIERGRGITKQREVLVYFMIIVKECIRGRRVFKQVLALFYLKNRKYLLL